MDNIGDIFYIIILIIITIAGAFSKHKEKRRKGPKLETTIEQTVPVSQEEREIPNENNETDELMREVAEKMRKEEEKRLHEEQVQLRELTEKLNTQKNDTTVLQKSAQLKKEEAEEQHIIDELEGNEGVVYDVDLLDVNQVREAFISAEILNKKY